MRNRQPIFIVGFARGGTSLVWDLLLSAPELCGTGIETHQVFRGRWARGPVRRVDPAWLNMARLLCAYLPVLLLQRQDVFAQRWYGQRRSFGRAARAWIDLCLHLSKMHARSAQGNLFKGPGVRYTRDEIESARLLGKNVNGLICLTPNFAEMYPDATFVAVVRNGLAVCEGQMRRGVSCAEAARGYAEGCRRIIADADRFPRCHVVRFEDMLADLEGTTAAMYAACGLDFADLKQVRFVPTETRGREGAPADGSGMAVDALNWCAIGELERHLLKDINERQVARLARNDRQQIMDLAGDALRHFGYA